MDMILNSKYLEENEQILNCSLNTVRSSEKLFIHHLNPNNIDIIFTDLKLLEFKNLYPYIIKGFIELGYNKYASNLLNNALVEYVKLFDYYNENGNKDRIDIKTQINSFYQKLCFFNVYDSEPNYPFLIKKYLDSFYNDILFDNGNKILYINTDHIFFTGELIINTNLPFTIKEVRFGIFNAIRKYITFNEEFKVVGIKDTSYINSKISLMTAMNRENKIKSLGL